MNIKQKVFRTVVSILYGQSFIKNKNSFNLLPVLRYYLSSQITDLGYLYIKLNQELSPYLCFNHELGINRSETYFSGSLPISEPCLPYSII